MFLLQGNRSLKCILASCMFFFCLFVFVLPNIYNTIILSLQVIGLFSISDKLTYLFYLQYLLLSCVYLFIFLFNNLFSFVFHNILTIFIFNLYSTRHTFSIFSLFLFFNLYSTRHTFSISSFSLIITWTMYRVCNLVMFC